MAIFGDSPTAASHKLTAGAGSGNGWRVLKAVSLSLALAGAALVMLVAAGCVGEEQTATSVEAVDTGGRLQLTETAFDGGTVPVGEKVEHAFIIRNTGTGPLEMGQMSVKLLEGC